MNELAQNGGPRHDESSAACRCRTGGAAHPRDGSSQVKDPTVSLDGDDSADDVAGADRCVGRGLRIAAKLERHAAGGCRRRDDTMGEQSHAMTAQQDVSTDDLLRTDGNDGNRFTVPDGGVHAVALSPEAHRRSVCKAVDDH
jgi:hypothetical protein